MLLLTDVYLLVAHTAVVALFAAILILEIRKPLRRAGRYFSEFAVEIREALRVPAEKKAGTPEAEEGVPQVRRRTRVRRTAVRAQREAARPRADSWCQTDEQPAPPPPDQECVVCLDARRDAAFAECGHMCACAGCAPWVTACPVCRGPAKPWIRVFV